MWGIYEMVASSEFYLGEGGFHGWLYGRLVEINKAVQTAEMWRLLLSRENRERVRSFGVTNLSLSLAELVTGDYDPWCAIDYARRVKTVAWYRSRIDEAYERWVAACRDWHFQGCRPTRLAPWESEEYVPSAR